MKWFMLAAACLITPASAQTKGEWFKGLRQPDTGHSCCDISDCKPTYKWEYKDGQWWAEWKGNMVPIPQNKILNKPPFPWDVEQAILCASPVTIFCFLPPAIGG